MRSVVALVSSYHITNNKCLATTHVLFMLCLLSSTYAFVVDNSIDAHPYPNSCHSLFIYLSSQPC